MSIRRLKGRRLTGFTLLAGPAAGTAPAISGNAYVGSTLTTTNGTWSGGNPSSYSYQWKRGVTNVGTDQNTYVPVTGDIGSTITVVVTATNPAGSASQTSAATAAVIAVPVNTVAPAVTGNAYVGSTLTCSTGTWSGGGSQTYSYQWKVGGVNAGTDQNTYVPITGNIGSTVTCTVTASNAAGAGTGVASAATAAVIGLPTNTVAPAITGTAQVGSTLTSSTGTWTGGGSITYAYQWKSAGSNVGTNQNTYVPVNGDVGNTITVTVTATNAAGSGTPAVSAATAAISGTPWTPAALGSALRTWWQADLLSGSNGDPQTTIADSSGNSFTLTAAGAQRATLAAADLNSKNTLRFTAASAQRYVVSSSVFSGASAASAYLVYKVVSVAVNNGLMCIGQAGNDAMPFSNGLYYEDFGSTSRKDGMTATASSATSYRIVSLYSATADWAFYMDGGSGGSGGGTSPVSSTAVNVVGFNAGTQYIGVNAGLTGLDGWVAEIFFTNAKQSTGDRQKAEGYLAWKWGLVGNLSASHPYKNAAPTT